MLVSPMKKSTLSSTEPCSAVIVQELLQDDWLSRLLMLPLDWLLLLLMPEEWIWCSVFTGGWKTSTEYLENIIIEYRLLYLPISVTRTSTCLLQLPPPVCYKYLPLHVTSTFPLSVTSTFPICLKNLPLSVTSTSPCLLQVPGVGLHQRAESGEGGAGLRNADDEWGPHRLGGQVTVVLVHDPVVLLTRATMES